MTIIKKGNGIEVGIEGKTVLLDPKRAEGISFVSHAHSDHAPRKVSGAVVASPETSALLGLGETVEELEVSDHLRLKAVPSGHMLGSSQIIMENGATTVFTGDLNVEGGFTTGRPPVPKCDILIIETTFGSPYYSFPDKAEVAKEMRDWADTCHQKDETPVVMAYAMGKAQEMTKALSERFQVVVHDKVHKNNMAYENHGVDLGQYDLMGDGDRVMIIPPGKKYLEELKGLNTRTAVATGWALHGGAAHRYGAETAFPVSDHSDFAGLVSYVEEAGPQVVYTVHGFAEEFSQELRQRGFYSEPLG